MNEYVITIFDKGTVDFEAFLEQNNAHIYKCKKRENTSEDKKLAKTSYKKLRTQIDASRKELQLIEERAKSKIKEFYDFDSNIKELKKMYEQELKDIVTEKINKMQELLKLME